MNKDFLMRLYEEALCIPYTFMCTKQYNQLKENPEIIISDEDYWYYKSNWNLSDFCSHIALYDFKKYNRLIMACAILLEYKFGIDLEDVRKEILSYVKEEINGNQ